VAQGRDARVDLRDAELYLVHLLVRTNGACAERNAMKRISFALRTPRQQTSFGTARDLILHQVEESAYFRGTKACIGEHGMDAAALELPIRQDLKEPP
jgi:hypothetical protein